MTSAVQLDFDSVTARRDEILREVAENGDEWDALCIDRAILTVADRGAAFSANAVRPLLPVLKSNNLVGARFNALRTAGRIRRVKGQYEPSTSPETHGHPIAVWIKA